MDMFDRGDFNQGFSIQQFYKAALSPKKLRSLSPQKTSIYKQIATA